MEINRNNYEAYFIDYLEGQLDERLVDDFIEFIKLNPDLKDELELFESVSAPAEHVSFSKKESLYKNKYDSEIAFNEAAIANMEGDISTQEKLEFDTYLNNNPDRKKEAAAFAKTKLSANLNLTYQHKNKLYKKSGRKIFLLWSGRVAAILVVAIAIASLIKLAPNETNFEKNVAELTEINTAKEEKESSPELKVAPVKPKKSEPIKKKKPKAKPALKKAEPEKKQHKSIRETTKGRLENEDIAMLRIPLEIPAKMQAISATLDVKPPKATMATMYISYPDEYYEEEWLLADQVKEKFSFNKITKAGLDLVASISNNNFTYQTNSEGKVTEYNYDSRLLAFSVPHNRTNSK